MALEGGQAQMRHPQGPAPTFTITGPHSPLKTDVPPQRPPPIVTMSGNELPTRTDSMVAPQGMWTTPSGYGLRARPATIHEGFSYCMPESYEGMESWDSAAVSLQQTPTDTMSSRPISVHQDFYAPQSLHAGTWAQKPCEDNLELHGIDPELAIGQAFTADEAIPIIDLRYTSGPHVEGETVALDTPLNRRRMSGSSFTVSTSGGLSDMPSYEDFSAALSDAPSFSDYPPTSNRNSLMSSTQLSPVASPRMTPQSRPELVRTQSRGRASPSPRPGVRAAPYSVESARNKRWSTGSYAVPPTRRPTSFAFHHPFPHEPYNAIPQMPHRHTSPTSVPSQAPLSFGNLQAVQQHPYMLGSMPAFARNSLLLPSQVPSNGLPHDMHHLDTPPPLLSHGLFRMLQSNADVHSLHGHYTNLSDPPDLYASLQEEQLPPPEEDMNPSDPDLVPHEQELRFEGDLYTPRWVRGHGNKREGWCGICRPGRWLVLKNSAFWYDKSFTHGISAATGSPFQEPQETRRMDGNPDVWEGLCGSCNDWIALVSSKKKGTTWFRHAYKCHTHPKIKDAPKRRRESSHSRPLTTPTAQRPRTEPQMPLTPQMTPCTTSVGNTPTPVTAHATLLQQTPTQQQHQQLDQSPVRVQVVSTPLSVHIPQGPNLHHPLGPARGHISPIDTMANMI